MHDAGLKIQDASWILNQRVSGKRATLRRGSGQAGSLIIYPL